MSLHLPHPVYLYTFTSVGSPGGGVRGGPERCSMHLMVTGHLVISIVTLLVFYYYDNYQMYFLKLNLFGVTLVNTAKTKTWFSLEI